MDDAPVSRPSICAALARADPVVGEVRRTDVRRHRAPGCGMLPALLRTPCGTELAPYPRADIVYGFWIGTWSRPAPARCLGRMVGSLHVRIVGADVEQHRKHVMKELQEHA